MFRLILLNKPFGVLCQFTDQEGRETLADFISVPGVYPAGRLDKDSEGLLLLTDDGSLQARIAQPRFRLLKRYLAQVEGSVGPEALAALVAGVPLRDGKSRPAEVEHVVEPAWLWPRDPPVRYRKSIPTDWVSIGIREGRNRQVRRMTAAVGHPTLRLVRTAVGPFELNGLAPGQWREADPGLLQKTRR